MFRQSGMPCDDEKTLQATTKVLSQELRAYFQRTKNDDEAGDDDKWVAFAEKFYSMVKKHSPPSPDRSTSATCRYFLQFDYPAACAVRDRSCYGYVNYGYDDDGTHVEDVLFLFQHPYEWFPLAQRKNIKEEAYYAAQEKFTEAVVNFMRTAVPSVQSYSCQWKPSEFMHMHVTNVESSSKPCSALVTEFQALEKEIIKEMRITIAMPHVKDA